MSTLQADFYRKNGYLVVPDLFTAAEMQELKAETARIFRGERGPVEGLLEVAPQKTDAEVLRKYLAIHFPHKLSPVIASGYRRGPDAHHRAKCEMHTVHAVRQRSRKAGAVLASGRVLHSHPRSLVGGGVDRN
jgi:hypothetical protein